VVDIQQQRLLTPIIPATRVANSGCYERLFLGPPGKIGRLESLLPSLLR